MTHQTQTPQPTPQETAIRSHEISSPMARIIGALRARREAAALDEEKQSSERSDELAEQPPVEWALRLMM